MFEIKNRLSVAALAAGLALVSGADRVLAQQPQIAKLLASDGGAHDLFGNHLALEGDVAVIASPLDDDLGVDAGAVYVRRFDGTTWVEEQKLVASDGAAYDYFGDSVDISGSRIVVGAYGHDGLATDAGAAYVFTFDGNSWSEETKLFATDATAGDAFGNAAAIDNKLIVVGATGADLVVGDEGAAYVFRRGSFGWLEEKKLTASDAGQYDYFGQAISVSGSAVLIGTQHGTWYDGGAAYFFRDQGGTWIEENRFQRPDNGLWFGASVDMQGDLAVIGMPGDDDLGWESGSAFVLRYDGANWQITQKLLGSNITAYDHFGQSVSTDGTMTVVGSPWKDKAATDSGIAYVYLARPDGILVEETTLGASDAAVWDNGGIAVAVSGNRAIVGSHGDDDLGTDAGSVNVYSIAEFTLTATPETVNAGDKLTLVAAYNQPGDPVLLVIAEVNGTPAFLPVLVHVFGADHQFTLPITVPQGLSGFDVGFDAYKRDILSKITVSTRAQVLFQ